MRECTHQNKTDAVPGEAECLRKYLMMDSNDKTTRGAKLKENVKRINSDSCSSKQERRKASRPWMRSKLTNPPTLPHSEASVSTDDDADWLEF
jgi:hypothetical protein